MAPHQHGSGRKSAGARDSLTTVNHKYSEREGRSEGENSSQPTNTTSSPTSSPQKVVPTKETISWTNAIIRSIGIIAGQPASSSSSTAASSSNWSNSNHSAPPIRESAPPARHQTGARGGGMSSLSFFLLRLLGGPGGVDPRNFFAVAAPGLITLLDVALYRANEGDLTATVCAANALLNAFLELKRRSEGTIRAALNSRAYIMANHPPSSDLYGSVASAGNTFAKVAYAEELVENFARLCLDCANGAIERISTERLAASANLELNSSHHPYGGDDVGVGLVGSDSAAGITTASSTSRSGLSSSSTDKIQTGFIGDARDMMEVASFYAASGLTTTAAAIGRRRRTPRRDCWETCRLLCPDYVWADDVLSYCQRILRSMGRHQFVSSMVLSVPGGGMLGSGHHHGHGVIGGGSTSSSSVIDSVRSWLSLHCIREADAVLSLLRNVIPARLDQFRSAVESNSAASKRLYLVKTEYRAPFRAFCESHTLVQRAPSIDLVDLYLHEHQEVDSKKRSLKSKRLAAERKIKETMENPVLLEALQLEQRCELMEIGMAQMLLPFSDLARWIGTRRGRLREVPGLLRACDIPAIYEVLRRLKSILVRESEGVIGIRSLLLDLQGLARDDDAGKCPSARYPFGFYDDKSEGEAIQCRISTFLSQLQCLVELGRTRGAFHFLDGKKVGSSSSSSSSGAAGGSVSSGSAVESDFPLPLIKSCTSSLDPDLFRAQFDDWYDMVKKQRALLSGERKSSSTSSPSSLEELAETMRRAEIELGIAVAPKASLEMVRQRLSLLEKDWTMKFDVLADVVQDVCLREMGMHMYLNPPEKDTVLELPKTSAMGIFGKKLLMEGEYLPE